MADNDNDDVNKSSKKTINEVGRVIKHLEEGLTFIPAGEVAQLEKIRKLRKRADELDREINSLRAKAQDYSRRADIGVAQIAVLSQQYSGETDKQKRRQLAEEISSARNEVGVNAVIAQKAEEGLPPLQKELNKIQKFTSEKAELVETKSAARQEAKQRQAIGQIESIFSESSFRGQSLRERINVKTVYAANTILARGATYEDLEKKLRQQDESVAQIQEKAIAATGNLFDIDNQPTGRDKELLGLYKGFKNLVKSRAATELAMQSLTSQGKDPQSRELRINRTASLIAQQQEENRLESEIRSGKISIGGFTAQGALRQSQIDVKDAGTKLAEEMDNFNRILAEKSKAAAQGSENLEEFNRKLEVSANNIDKLNDVVEKTGDGGGGKGYRAAASLMQAGFALQSVGGAIGQIFVGQTNTITNTKIASAQQANDLFFRRQAALSGDMTQLTALSQGAPQLAEIEASRSKFLTNVSGTFDAVGEAAEAAGTIVGAAATGGLSGGISGGTRAGSIAAAVSKTASASTNIIGLMRGVNGNAEGRAEYNRRMQLSDEEIKIKGFQRQQFYNYSMGITDAALIGGGAAGQRFFQQMLGGEDEYGPVRSSDQILERMKVAGISTDQMVQMGQMGLAQQGSVFSADQVFAAKALQNKGYGTLESNMRMYGQLAGAGANNPSGSFEKILEVAVAKGFDSSKATSMLVENIAAISQRSTGAALGMDVTGGALASIAGIAASKEEQPNREFALSRAATAAQAYEAISSNTGTSLTTMATASRIQRAAGVDYKTALLLQGMDRATVQNFYSQAQKYEKMSPNEKTTFKSQLESAGLFEFVDKKTGGVRLEALKSGINIKNQGNLFGQLLFSGEISSQEMPMFEKFMSGKYQELEKTQKGRDFLNRMNRAAPLATRSSTGIAMTGLEVSRAGSLEEMSPEELEKARKDMEQKRGATFEGSIKLKDAAAREQTTQAQLGAQEMGGITEAISRIAEATQVISKMGMDGKSGNFSELASKAASEFNSGAEFFKTGMVFFDKALDKLSVKVDMPKPERPLNRKL
jgi:hypothetical protein